MSTQRSVMMPVVPYVAPPQMVNSYDATILMDLSTVAVPEVIKMAAMGAPLWIPDASQSRDMINYAEYARLFPRYGAARPAGFVSEVTRDSTVVNINDVAFVEALMNKDTWMNMFPSIIGQSRIIDVISTGVNGTKDGTLQLMHAELQVLSTLVSVREVTFLRHCRQQAEGAWVVVDVSVNLSGQSNQNLTFRKLPSGCLVEALPDGKSKITWVEHTEYDETFVHPLYHPLLQSGLGLGAQRWIADLQRHCAILATFSAPLPDHFVITPVGRSDMIDMACRMSTNFYGAVCGTPSSNWRMLVLPFESTIRAMVRKFNGPSSGNVADVLSVATSVWIPVEPLKVFEFLKDGTNRGCWDLVTNVRPTVEMATIVIGDTKNVVSVLRQNEAATADLNNKMILQAASVDSSCLRITYVPIEARVVQAVMEGTEPTYASVPPSGIVISPDCTVGGSLMTVALQFLICDLPDKCVTNESIIPAFCMINDMVQNISVALEPQE